jgi:hypothetical protein
LFTYKNIQGIIQKKIKTWVRPERLSIPEKSQEGLLSLIEVQKARLISKTQELGIQLKEIRNCQKKD